MQRLIKFARRPTSVDIVVNTGGSVLNVIFGAAIHFILFRLMTPVNYGVLTIWLSLSYVLSTMLDFGTTATIYAYLPPLLQARGHSLHIFLKSIFSYQAGLAAVSAAILIVAFPLMDVAFFKTHASWMLMGATIVAIFLFIIQNFVTNLLYASREFVRPNLYINLSNLLKALILVALIPLHITDVTTIFSVITIGGSLIFFVPIIIHKRRAVAHILRAPLERGSLRLRYTFTYLVATQIFNLGQRMDLFLLSYFGLRAEAGYYAAAQKIVLSIASAVISITQVLSPQFSHINTKAAARRILLHTFYYLSAPAAVFAILYILPGWVFTLYLEKFARAATVTRALAVPYIIYAYANMFLIFLLYCAKKPGIILAANVVFFGVMLVGCATLIPGMKLAAPPIVITTALICATMILGAATYYEYRKLS